jgi:putative phosphoesterase
MRIGVISDTHNFLDPKVAELFAGLDHILHGGDIGSPKILWELERLAPVTAVAGNTDDAAFGYPLNQTVELSGRKFLLQHIVDPRNLDPELQAKIEIERPDVVIFGHTHKPFCERLAGVLYFNPGYTGKPRFGMERTLAILHCESGGLRPEYFPL